MRKIILSLTLLFAVATARAQLSLEAYRDMVYEYSTSLMNAEAATSRAYSDMRVARTDFLPSLSASANFTTDFRRSGDAHLWGFDLQPQLQQILYGGGAVRATYSRTQAEYERAKYGERHTRLAMRYAADYAYWTVSAMKLYISTLSRCGGAFPRGVCCQGGHVAG